VKRKKRTGTLNPHYDHIPSHSEGSVPHFFLKIQNKLRISSPHCL